MGNSSDIDRMLAQMSPEQRAELEQAGTELQQNVIGHEQNAEGLQVAGATPNDKELGVSEYVSRENGDYHRRESIEPQQLDRDIEPDR